MKHAQLLFPLLFAASSLLGARALSSPIAETDAAEAYASPRDTAAYRREIAKAFSALRHDSLSVAQRALEAALAHDPDAAGNEILHFNIAKILMARRQWHDAEQRLRALLTRRPDYSEARVALAQCLAGSGQDRALVQWVAPLTTAANDLSTGNVLSADERNTLLFLQSEAYARLHQDEQALSALREVLKTDRRNARAHSLIALHLYERGQRDEALLHLGTALIHGADDETALAVGADLAEREGDKATALERLARLLRLRPNDRDLQVHRAQLLIDLGQRAAARHQLDSMRAAAGDEAAEQLLPLYHRLR